MAKKGRKTRPAKGIAIHNEFDQLTNKILNDDELNEAEQEQFDRLVQTWSVMQNNVYVKARKIIEKQHRCTSATATAWMRKASDFFGEIETINVKAERLKQKMRLEALLDHPKTNTTQKIQIEKLLSEILGTKDHEKEAKDDRKRPVFIIHQYTTDEKVFDEQEREINYEDIS